MKTRKGWSVEFDGDLAITIIAAALLGSLLGGSFWGLIVSVILSLAIYHFINTEP